LHVPGARSGQKYETLSVIAARKSEKKKPLTLEPDRETLISLLPPQTQADRLIHAYVDLFENTYRVFHVPTFLQRHNWLWDLPDTLTEKMIV
jgi:hypothetical protein